MLADPGYVSYPWEQQCYLTQSRYELSVQPWVDLYGRDRLLVLASEDYYTDPVATLGRVDGFLGLPRRTSSSGTVRNAAPGQDLPPEIHERLSAELEALPEAPFARPRLVLTASGPRAAEALAEELARQRPRDRAAQRTLTGPHRDDLEVAMAGKDAPAASCSTGEQKAMLIAITLAHAGLAAAGRPGVLLLDEVAAHLDPLRRDALFERLSAGQAQVWLTGTEPAPFAGILGEAATWRVSGGQVERLS